MVAPATETAQPPAADPAAPLQRGYFQGRIVPDQLWIHAKIIRIWKWNKNFEGFRT
jgi:hypothetical protein